MKAPLDSKQLRAFCVLARTGSFTQAARELHLTQSGISHSIKTLEIDTGCRLFDRLGGKVALTHAGEQLLEHATKLVHEMERARETMRHVGKWGHGRLRVGASATACQRLLPPVLREFKECFPECAIAIQLGDTLELVDLLLDHQIDLALSLEPGKEVRLDFHPLFTDELRFVVSASHPWAQAGRVFQKEIPRQNYIHYGKRSLTFRLIEEYFNTRGMVLNTVIELGSMEATKELVKLGLGVSILAPWIARQEIEEASLVSLPLGRRKLKRRWGILHRQGKRLNLVQETFIGLCESAVIPFQGKPEPCPRRS